MTDLRTRALAKFNKACKPTGGPATFRDVYTAKNRAERTIDVRLRIDGPNGLLARYRYDRLGRLTEARA